MSLIIPKPRPLYAPMLATFGGGSARGFGRNLPSGGSIFTLTGRVYQSSPDETLRYNATAGINGNNEEAKNTSFISQSNFPSTIMDVAWAVDDPTVIRLVAVKESGTLHTVPLDFTSSTTPTTTTHSYLSGTRGMMMLRNGVFVTFNNSQDRMATWKMNTNATFSKYTDVANSNNFGNIQCIINPNNGAESGDNTFIFIAGSGGGRLDCVRVDGNGDINIKNDFSLSSAGANIWMSPMKSTDADKLRFMVFASNQNVKVLDYNISSNSYTTVSNGVNLNLSTFGSPISATPSWGGFTYVGFQTQNSSANTLAKFYQNGNLGASFTNTSYVMDYQNAVLAIEDGTSSRSANGNVYWGGYNNDQDPERRLMAVSDNDGTSFANQERSNARLTLSRYTNGGCVIGERSRYAEMDAKLESTNW